MKFIFSLANKFLKSRKSRTTLSIIGISIGFVLLISSNILMSTLEKSNENIIKAKYGDYDLIVGYQKSSSFLDNNIVNKINEFESVKQTTPFLYPYIGENSIYKEEMQYQPMYIGLRDDSLSRQHQFAKLFSGSLPGKEEVVIPYSWAKSKGLEIGSTITLPFPPNKEKKARISGIMEKNEHIQGIVLFQYDWLATATSQKGHTTVLMMKLHNWETKGEVITELKDIDSKFFIDNQRQMNKEREQLGGLKPIVQGLNIAVLIGSVLLLISTLQMSIQEKKKELATLRLLGARKGQIGRLVIFEASIIATFSAIIGIVFGIGLSYILKSLITKISGIAIEKIYIDPLSIISSVLIGIFITIVASFIPAAFASKLSPIQAYSQSIDTEHKKKIIFLVLTVCLILLSVGLSFINYQEIHDNKLYVLSVGILILSIFMGISFLLKYTVKILTFFIKPFLRQYSLLASRNTIRQLRRSIQIVSVVMLGVIISIVGLSVLNLVKQETEKYIMDQYPLSHVIDSNSGYDEPGLPLTFYKEIENVPEIQSIPIYKNVAVYTQNFKFPNSSNDNNFMLYTVNGKKEINVGLEGVDFKKIKALFPIKVIEGSIDSNTLNNGGVIITDYMSKAFDYKLNDEIQVITEDELIFKGDEMIFKNEDSKKRLINLKVTGIINGLSIQDNEDLAFYTSTSFIKEQFNLESIQEIHYKVLNTDSKKIDEKVENLIENQTSSQIILYNRQIELDTLKKQFNQRLTILLSSIFLICSLAFIGLMNGMASSLRERAREFATIRALGIKKRSIVLLTLLEGAMVTLSGGILGIIFGSILLNQLLLALGNKGIIFPWIIVLVTLIVSPIIGLLATVVPAIYLSNKNILKQLADQ